MNNSFSNVCATKIVRDMETKERTCIYALSRITMYEPRIAKALMDNSAGAAEIFSKDQEELELLMGAYSRYPAAIANADLGAYEKELDALLARGCRYLTMGDEDFPALLKECEDAPIGLFVQASDNDHDIFGRESISIVGTRSITPYGREWCRKIVETLSRSQTRPTIVSGLAYGVDICSHLAALEAGLPTIAVLGTGIFNTYPSSHQRYADRIAQSPGCAVVSEYPPDVNVTPVNFLSRNRVIAGLSRCTLLIESRIKGGGMSTARTAASYNRDVFALPGRTDDPCSQGCNYLIHSHIAEPIIGCEEFFRALDYKLVSKGGRSSAQSMAEYYGGSMDEADIRCVVQMMKTIRKERGISISELAAETGIEHKKANVLLRRLENDGFIMIDMLQQCSEFRKIV